MYLEISDGDQHQNEIKHKKSSQEHDETWPVPRSDASGDEVRMLAVGVSDTCAAHGAVDGSRLDYIARGAHQARINPVSQLGDQLIWLSLWQAT